MKKIDWDGVPGRVVVWVFVVAIVAAITFMFGLYESRTGMEHGWSPVGPWFLLVMGSIFLGWRARNRESWKTENVSGLAVVLTALMFITSYTEDCDWEGCISHYNLALGAEFTLLAFTTGFSVGLIFGVLWKGWSAVHGRMSVTR